MALAHPELHVYFSHAHNLFLDLILWCGWPLGLAVSACLVWWLVSRAVRVRTAEDALLFLLVLVVANHAMLELPLHHAYFLLPVGLVIGALDVRLGVPSMVAPRRWLMPLAWAAWLLAAALLALIIRDYARVETAYQGLRFEWANVKTPPVEPPEVLLLTQWHDFVRMVKWDLRQPARDEDLQWMQHVLSLNPNIGLFQVYATALAGRGQPEPAAHWLRTMCVSVSAAQCDQVAAFWNWRAGHDPAIAAVPWPPHKKAQP
jgi:Virulence factor membrane-bound polymerase, C-terminal